MRGLAPEVCVHCHWGQRNQHCRGKEGSRRSLEMTQLCTAATFILSLWYEKAKTQLLVSFDFTIVLLTFSYYFLAHVFLELVHHFKNKIYKSV